MTPSTARALLISQHDQIRNHLNHCSVLARRMREGDPVHAELDAALSRLRSEFADHNTTETSLVRPLLHDSPRWGALLVDRMLEEHLAEHAAFWEMLAGSTAEVVTRMDELVEELDAHMAAEERTFLSPVVLHQDAIDRHREEPT